jgi:hypothetical protein
MATRPPAARRRGEQLPSTLDDVEDLTPFATVSRHKFGAPLRPAPEFSINPTLARRARSLDIEPWSVTPARMLICILLSPGSAAITVTVR